MTKRKIVCKILIVFLICIIWIAGFSLGFAHARPETVIHYKDSSHIREKPVYIEVNSPPELIEVTNTVYVNLK